MICNLLKAISGIGLEVIWTAIENTMDIISIKHLTISYINIALYNKRKIFFFLGKDYHATSIDFLSCYINDINLPFFGFLFHYNITICVWFALILTAAVGNHWSFLQNKVIP